VKQEPLGANKYVNKKSKNNFKKRCPSIFLFLQNLKLDTRTQNAKKDVKIINPEVT